MSNNPPIIREWNKILVPPPPELSKVNINPSNATLLILDIQVNNCNQERRPRCIQSLPLIKYFLTLAREKKLLVVYSLTSSASKEHIREEVKPLDTEPIVKSSVDKIYSTHLEQIFHRVRLIQNNIQYDIY